MRLYRHYEVYSDYMIYVKVKEFASKEQVEFFRYSLEDMKQEMYLRINKAIQQFKK